MSEPRAESDTLAAIAQVRTAAAAGDIAAQALYAQMLSEGRGLALDPVESLHWYTLAANSGDAAAMNMVGRCNELGHGTPVNLELAAAWYRKSARHGLDWGLYNYAQLLAKGRGVKADRKQAFALYRRAAELGHAKAMNMVGRYYDEGWEVERDAVVAESWYRKSALGGDFRGQTSYASILAQKGDVVAAAEWLRRAAVTATPAFLERLVEDLARAPHALLRDVAAEMRGRLPQPNRDTAIA